MKKPIEGLTPSTVKVKAAEMTSNGFCTHYAGYTCDKEFPAACQKCIERWLRRYLKEMEETK